MIWCQLDVMEQQTLLCNYHTWGSKYRVILLSFCIVVVALDTGVGCTNDVWELNVADCLHCQCADSKGKLGRFYRSIQRLPGSTKHAVLLGMPQTEAPNSNVIVFRPNTGHQIRPMPNDQFVAKWASLSKLQCFVIILTCNDMQSWCHAASSHEIWMETQDAIYRCSRVSQSSMPATITSSVSFPHFRKPCAFSHY